MIASPRASLVVDVPRAATEQLRTLAQQSDAGLHKLGLSGDERAHLVNRILFTSHRELLPVALRHFKESIRRAPCGVVQFVYDSSATPREAHALLIDHLLEQNPVAAEDIFHFWDVLSRQASLRYAFPRIPTPRDIIRSVVWGLLDPGDPWIQFRLLAVVRHFKAKQLLLPDDQLWRLCQARNVWVKALIYATFSERCERSWTAGLMRELRQMNTPLPPEKFKRLLRQLDDGRFAVRERASAELLRLRDAVEPALRDGLKQALSLELRRRIERLLAEIERAVPDPMRRDTLAHLAWVATPEARAVLETLSQGLPRARLTKEAAAALKDMNKQAQPPR